MKQQVGITKKKVLIHSIAFSPDGVSTAYLYNDIAEGLIQNGFDVVVLTTTPHYNVVAEELSKQPLKRRLFGLFYTSYYKNIKVIHVPQRKYSSALFRIISFVYWHILSFFIALLLRNINIVISPSPPLTIGILSAVIGRLKGARVIYNVQEIYPDLLINSGALKNKMLIWLLYKTEKLVYRWSDGVVTIDEVFFNTILPRIDKPDKLIVIPNFVDTGLYKPITKGNTWNEGHFTSKLKVLYAGNIGLAQDWEPLLETASRLRDEPVNFYIIGEGVQKSELEREINKKGLNNIIVMPYQPREIMPMINSFADIHFIAMNPKLEGEGFPSKVYSIMASSKPLIVLTGKETPLNRFLQDKGCAIIIHDDRVNGFTAAIRSIIRDPSGLDEMGRKGWKVIQDQYSREIVIKKYVNYFGSIAAS